MFFIEAPKYRMMILFAISMIASWIIFTPILKIAKRNNLMDNPEDRKLQKQPIPVLGGAAVFFGIIIGLSFFKTMLAYVSLFPVISAMVIMLYIGIIDDMLGIRPWKRFVIEVLVGLLLIYGNRFYISNFQGIWGILRLPNPIGVTISAFAFVGIVNAINMIDGVDGLCSGICIFVCCAFGLVFFLARDYSYAALAAITAGSAIPFFLHNVFGWNSKMFLGDGGTMVMGTMISAMVFELLKNSFFNPFATYTTELGLPFDFFSFGLIPFALAVLSMPVFDTLRVMFERVIEGKSPFMADNRHFHHLLIKTGYSYIFTTIIEIALDVLVVAAFAAAWIFGAGVDVQLYVVVAVALVVDFGGAYFLRRVSANPESKFARKLASRAAKSHIERKGIWLKTQRLVDGKQ